MKGAGRKMSGSHSTAKPTMANARKTGAVGTTGRSSRQSGGSSTSAQSWQADADRQTVRVEGRKVISEHRRLLEKLRDY